MISRIVVSVALVALGGGLLVGCGNGLGTAASASASSSSSAPRPSATPSVASPVPSAPTAPSASGSAAGFVESAEPELAEWGKAREIKVPGSGTNSCETKLVREWLRVMCVNRAPDLGVPVRIEVTKGRGANERSKGENLKAVNDITTLIVPVRPGSDYEASFSWANGSHVLTASWPSGTPESARTIAFDNGTDAAPAASPAESAALPVAGSSSPDARGGALPPPEAPIDDVAGLADPPTDEDWKKAAEVRVAGSTAAGCETKVSGDWFRARCASPDNGLDALVAVKGHHKTQTKIFVGDGAATVVTPYVEGTETWVRYKSGETTRTLVLRWKKGPRPDTAGAFEGGK